MAQTKIGIDMADIARFRALSRSSLVKLFSKREIARAKMYKDPAPHLAGMFAAKEAASKALGTKQFPFFTLEIRHAKDGAPEVWKDGKKVRVSVSITHTRSLAAAIAVS